MRTFFALELPATVKLRLRQEQKELQARLAQAGLDRVLRWSNVENLHLTLRFLGETSPDQVAALKRDGRRMVARHETFTLGLAGLGCFASWRKLRVLWVGVQGDLAALQALQRDIEALAQAVGFPAETKAFSPHITLARSRRDAGLPALRAAGALLEETAAVHQKPPLLGDWTATELLHMRSVLAPGGARYSTLARLPLGGQKAPPTP